MPKRARAAADPQERQRAAALQALRSFAVAKRRAAQAAAQRLAAANGDDGGATALAAGGTQLTSLPEFMLPHLIFLLSVHPDCPEVVSAPSSPPPCSGTRGAVLRCVCACAWPSALACQSPGCAMHGADGTPVPPCTWRAQPEHVAARAAARAARRRRRQQQQQQHQGGKGGGKEEDEEEEGGGAGQGPRDEEEAQLEHECAEGLAPFARMLQALVEPLMLLPTTAGGGGGGGAAGGAKGRGGGGGASQQQRQQQYESAVQNYPLVSKVLQTAKSTRVVLPGAGKVRGRCLHDACMTGRVRGARPQPGRGATSSEGVPTQASAPLLLVQAK